MIIQVQPLYREKDQYESLAKEEGLFYEVLELSMGSWTPEMKQEAVTWYRDSGRVTAFHGAFIDLNPVSAEPGIRRISRERYHESVRLAKLLGARYVVFHGTCFPFLRGPYLERWASESAAFYSELAEEYGLSMMIENSFDLDTTPLKELMRRANRKDMGICLDIGHANLSRMPVDHWFDELGEWIGCLHLSDNPGAFDDHMALGDGTINMEQLSERLRHLPSETPMTLEVGGIREVERSLNRLKTYGIGCR